MYIWYFASFKLIRYDIFIQLTTVYIFNSLKLYTKKNSKPNGQNSIHTNKTTYMAILLGYSVYNTIIIKLF